MLHAAQVYAEAAARLGVDLAAAPHAQRDFSLSSLPGGYRLLLHRPADLQFRLLQYVDPDQTLAATDLDALRGTAPPPVAVLGPGAAAVVEAGHLLPCKIHIGQRNGPMVQCLCMGF